MLQLTPLEPVDYLVIGHLTLDITPDGPRLGGTATYAALTAQALGLRVGIVTSWGAELPLGPLRSTPVVSFPTDQSTTFENVEMDYGRVQYIRHVAPRLDLYMIPEPWRGASIVHLAPVAQEVEPSLIRNFPSALIGITPQGWLRSWDSEGLVHVTEWPEAAFVLERAGATVISLQDVGASEDRLFEMAASSRVLAVTEAAAGSRVYWQGDVRRFSVPVVEEVDPVGAGDIFAAAFFVRLYTTRDPWEAARFANQLAANSVTRPGLTGIPTPEEIEESMVEIF
jgi:sugar/nucleoside kinase (ribokinase family)